MANLVKGFVRAKTIGLNDLRVGHEVMVYSAGYIKNGGGVNLQVRADLIIKALNLRASEYQLSMTDLRLFEFAAQARLLTAIEQISSTNDVVEQIAALAQFINDGQLAEMGQLTPYSNRYQVFKALDTLLGGHTETITLTTLAADGKTMANNVDVIRADGTRVTLAEYLHLTGRSSVIDLLAVLSNYELVDPIKKNPPTKNELDIDTQIASKSILKLTDLTPKFLESLISKFSRQTNPLSQPNPNIEIFLPYGCSIQLAQIHIRDIHQTTEIIGCPIASTIHGLEILAQLDPLNPSIEKFYIDKFEGRTQYTWDQYNKDLISNPQNIYDEFMKIQGIFIDGEYLTQLFQTNPIMGEINIIQMGQILQNGPVIVSTQVEGHMYFILLSLNIDNQIWYLITDSIGLESNGYQIKGQIRLIAAEEFIMRFNKDQDPLNVLGYPKSYMVPLIIPNYF
jgi:hypothetical protein